MSFAYFSIEVLILFYCNITSWQIEVENVKLVIDIVFLGSKITAVTTDMRLKDSGF